MYTRGIPQSAYASLTPAHTNIPGAMVIRPTGAVNSNKNIVAVMPIARPNSSPSGIGAPFYITGYQYPGNAMQRGGSMSLSPSRPRVETDLTDPTTWQRDYRFS